MEITLNRTQFTIYKSLVEAIFHDAFKLKSDETFQIPWSFDQLTQGVMIALRYGVTGRGQILIQRIIQNTPHNVMINGVSIPFDHIVEVIAMRLQHVDVEPPVAPSSR